MTMLAILADKHSTCHSVNFISFKVIKNAPISALFVPETDLNISGQSTMKESRSENREDWLTMMDFLQEHKQEKIYPRNQ